MKEKNGKVEAEKKILHSLHLILDESYEFDLN